MIQGVRPFTQKELKQKSNANKNSIHRPKSTVSSSKSNSDLISQALDGAPATNFFQVSIKAELAINDKDVFELSNESTPGTILISTSTNVAVAWAFNYHLKYIANSSDII
ncbi:unnamed protein product [Rotaria sordida]|uniref:Alpha-N-acetylglucosaminidase N-terminal domain-containing protein n=2 Tax=Rotaria sordida TaxID=392033 RepID=A0A820BDU6_9BILA|nr:unnamed protein product [Rotaria sordida]